MTTRFLARRDLWFTVAVSVGVALRLRQFAFNRSMWFDEATLADNFRVHDLSYMLTNTLDRRQSAPAGFLVATDAWTRVAGTSDLSLRFVPFVASLALVAASIVVATGAFRHRSTQLVFVGLAALSPSLVYYSSEFKQYGVDAALTMTLLACLVRVDTWRRGRWILAAVASVAMWTSVPSAFVAAGCGVAVLPRWIAADRRRALLGTAAIWLVAATSAALWSLWVSGKESIEILQSYWSTGFAPSPVHVSWYSDHGLGLVHLAFRSREVALPGTLPAWFDPLNLVLAIGVATGIGVGLVRRGPARPPLVGMVTALAAAIGASAFDMFPLEGRQILFLVPLVFLGAAILVEAIADLPATTNAAAAKAATLMMLGAAIIPAQATFRHPSNRYDLKTVLGQIDDDHDASIVITAWTKPAFVFYARDHSHLAPPIAVVDPYLHAEPFLDRMAELQPGLTWVVVSHRLPNTRPLLEAAGELTPPLEIIEGHEAAAFLFDFDVRFARTHERANTAS